jgi:hypothetical protein
MKISKVCGKCKLERPLEEFYKAKRRKDGCRSVCKDCDKQYYKQWCEENKDNVIRYRKEYYEKNKAYSKVCNK